MTTLDRPAGHVQSPFFPSPPFLYSQADAIDTAYAKTKTGHVRQRQLRSLSGWCSGLNRVCIVGKSLIFPIRPFALLPKFEDGKPGRETKGRPHASEVYG